MKAMQNPRMENFADREEHKIQIEEHPAAYLTIDLIIKKYVHILKQNLGRKGRGLVGAKRDNIFYCLPDLSGLNEMCGHNEFKTDFSLKELLPSHFVLQGEQLYMACYSSNLLNVTFRCTILYCSSQHQTSHFLRTVAYTGKVTCHFLKGTRARPCLVVL